MSIRPRMFVLVLFLNTLDPAPLCSSHYNNLLILCNLKKRGKKCPPSLPPPLCWATTFCPHFGSHRFPPKTQVTVAVTRGEVHPQVLPSSPNAPDCPLRLPSCKQSAWSREGEEGEEGEGKEGIRAGRQPTTAAASLSQGATPSLCFLVCIYLLFLVFDPFGQFGKLFVFHSLLFVPFISRFLRIPNHVNPALFRKFLISFLIKTSYHELFGPN